MSPYPPPRAPCLPAPTCIPDIYSILSAPTRPGQSCFAKPTFSAFGSHECSSSKPTRTAEGCSLHVISTAAMFNASRSSCQDRGCGCATCSIVLVINRAAVCPASSWGQEKSIGSAKSIMEGHLIAMLNKGEREEKGETQKAGQESCTEV